MHNFNAVSCKDARVLLVSDGAGWMDMIKVLKLQENGRDGSEPKYFAPITLYDNFKWNNNHINKANNVTNK